MNGGDECGQGLEGMESPSSPSKMPRLLRWGVSLQMSLGSSSENKIDTILPMRIVWTEYFGLRASRGRTAIDGVNSQLGYATQRRQPKIAIGFTGRGKALHIVELNRIASSGYRNDAWRIQRGPQRDSVGRISRRFRVCRRQVSPDACQSYTGPGNRCGCARILSGSLQITLKICSAKLGVI